jgi:hypothetical protein
MCEALKGKEWLKATLLGSPDQDIFPCKMVRVPVLPPARPPVPTLARAR